MAKIIAVSNQKGGVGKTTTSVNLAALLAVKGFRVLLIDLDPQANATISFGFTAKSNLRENENGESYVSTIYDVFAGNIDASDAAVGVKSVPNLQLIPSTVDFAAAEAELARLEKGREQILKNALFAVQDEFDFIVLDCAPALGLVSVNALNAADFVLVPIQCEYFALSGLAQLMNTVKMVKKHLNPALSLAGVLLTMYDSRLSLAKDVENEIRSYFASKLFYTKIPKNVRLAEAPGYGLAIEQFDRSSAGAKAYRAFTEEFLNRIETVNA